MEVSPGSPSLPPDLRFASAPRSLNKNLPTSSPPKRLSRRTKLVQQHSSAGVRQIFGSADIIKDSSLSKEPFCGTHAWSAPAAGAATDSGSGRRRCRRQRKGRGGKNHAVG